jgi:hypothetical protein
VTTTEPVQIRNDDDYGGEALNGVRILALGEDGDYLTAYGHHPKDQFAEACRQYGAEDVHPDVVDHVYAVLEHDELADEDDGYSVRWNNVQPSDLHAFPLTVWCADWSPDAP